MVGAANAVAAEAKADGAAREVVGERVAVEVDGDEPGLGRRSRR
jgi:hypothetical protein